MDSINIISITYGYNNGERTNITKRRSNFTKDEFFKYFAELCKTYDFVRVRGSGINFSWDKPLTGN